MLNKFICQLEWWISYYIRSRRLVIKQKIYTERSISSINKITANYAITILYQYSGYGPISACGLPNEAVERFHR